MVLARASLLVSFLHVALVLSKQCREQSVPVAVSARNAVFGKQERLVDDLDVTFFMQNMTTPGRNYTGDVLTGYTSIEDTYSISDLIKGKYWDPSIDPQLYSYIDIATDTFGYRTVSYDRLSTGDSSRPNPYSVVQLEVELAILDKLTTLVRTGQLLDIGKSSSVVHVGHSFGSILTFALAAKYPKNTDGIILTGFSQSPSKEASLITTAAFNAKMARSDNSTLWGKAGLNLDPGYLTWNDVYSNIMDFYYPPGSMRDVHRYAEATKQPFTVGELLTMASSPSMAPDFTGPAMVVTGQQDAIFCGINCYYTDGLPNVSSIPELTGRNLPKASAFNVLVQPNTGHALNLHLNATGAFRAINEFLGVHGL
ncbi:hypothetical protein PUNSTDRAFT_141952 [Punctularia strigosozonata HHB-11173 SS5]|uniref:uncharacterized protein n=1 Tax=Punctularia strigosozonata (strain HHB-11173) TaxID=741275 RepID=UPI0004416D33|nr:uncharacterized protein PUNSTDRAFT_141952 [Punctularia strigosozonata HHB-11173 SS5]EIN11667.1 hypothetical protein PUNSTDRAFT_141952 [Punctularia strigosozonata HHB-11173 SS5]